MFLVKSRDYYITDGNLFQIDVSFNSNDENYKKGYYIVISEVVIFKPNKKKNDMDFDVQVEKKYKESKMQLLSEQEEECEDVLSNCITMKESALNNIIDNSKTFARKPMILEDNTKANYSVDAIMTKPKTTLKILNELIETFVDLNNDETDDFTEQLDTKKERKNKNNSKKGYFKPINTSDFTFNNVAGLKEVKEELEQIVDFIKNPQKYNAMGAELPKGILLYGPPGTGKTLLAKALAGETNSKFFQVSGSEFVEKYVGVGAKRVRELFNTAKKEAPSIIFIDEIDAIGSSRNPDRDGEHNKTLNQLLVELDGFKDCSNVLVLAATNRIDSLDTALIRAGRLGEHLYIGNPDYESRKELFKIHTSNKPLDDELDLDSFAKKTHSFNGADIKSICNNAALFAIKDNADKININHFEKALDKVVVGLHSKTKKMIDEERKIVAYHEAGHALANYKLSSDKIEKISILPRGNSLGLVYKLPNEDRYLYTKQQFEDKIKILLAGRVAEEIFFKDVTNGASDDLKKASKIALRMVREYGMDTTNSLLTINDEKISTDNKDRAEIILQKCYKECKEFLESNQDIVEAIALKLLEVEEIGADIIKEIISDKRWYNWGELNENSCY